MNATSRARKRGFTLVELLTVIAIIGILSGLIVPRISHIRNRAKTAQANAMIEQISAALARYMHAEHGYPAEDSPADGCQNLLEKLIDSGCLRNLREGDTDGSGTAGNLIDPWGRPYIYLYDEDYVGMYPSAAECKKMGIQFNFYSCGKDGEDDHGEDDDVPNW